MITSSPSLIGQSYPGQGCVPPFQEHAEAVDQRNGVPAAVAVHDPEQSLADAESVTDAVLTWLRECRNDGESGEPARHH